MRAKDVMSVEVVTVTPDDSVAHAAALMLEHHVSGLPVVDADGALRGIVTEGDLLDRVELKSDEPWRRHPAAGREEAVANYIKTHARTVGDVMHQGVVTVETTTPLSEVADVMAREHIRRVVVTREGRVAGIVSRADLIRGMVSAPETAPSQDEDALRREILTRLHVDLGLPRSATGVTIRDGKAILWGSVPSEEERKAAQVAAENVAGADRVVSYLRVAGPPTGYREGYFKQE
jgi:CBS domain-containing protein